MNNSELVIFIFSGIFVIASFFVFVLYVISRNKRDRKLYHLEKTILQKQFQQTLLQSQLEIQEQTLRHVSHELHDNLGQIASLIKINLNTLNLDDSSKAIQKIEDTKTLTRQLISDLKSLSVGLGSDHLSKTGVIKALEIEIERLNKTGQFTATFSNDAGDIHIPADKAIILYRMVQEILNNCIKHANAKNIDLHLQHHNQENKYILAIRDDGVGFSIQDSGSDTSAGLKNLHNRAQLINANLNFYSTPGKGTEVIISIPDTIN